MSEDKGNNPGNLNASVKPGIRTKPRTVRNRTMMIEDVARRDAERARFAQRRADAPPDDDKPEGDAVDAVKDAEQQLAADAEHAGKSLLRRASAASRRKREAAQHIGEAENAESDENASTPKAYSQDISGSHDVSSSPIVPDNAVRADEETSINTNNGNRVQDCQLSDSRKRSAKSSDMAENSNAPFVGHQETVKDHDELSIPTDMPETLPPDIPLQKRAENTGKAAKHKYHSATTRSRKKNSVMPDSQSPGSSPAYPTSSDGQSSEAMPVPGVIDIQSVESSSSDSIDDSNRSHLHDGKSGADRINKEEQNTTHSMPVPDSLENPGLASEKVPNETPTAKEESPHRVRQNRSLLKRRDAVPTEADNSASDHAHSEQASERHISAPRNRLLSADELEKARQRRFGMIGTETPLSSVEAETPLLTVDTKMPGISTQSYVIDTMPAPRTRQQKSDLYHERPGLQLPKEKETLHEPVHASRVIESQPRIQIRTAETTAKLAGQRVNAAAQAAKEKAEEEASKRIASHMKELSKKAAERAVKALKASARLALRAIQAAGEALVSTITAGGGVVVVIMLVILMCASILASPFALFTHSDGIENPDSYTLTKAVAEINEEYVSEVKNRAQGKDNVSILIEGNIEGEIEPVNWVDVLGVFAVHVTMRADDAMNIVDLGEDQLKELRTVFWDMNTISVEEETEDGETTTYVLGKSLNYMDMVEKYHFNEQQVELLKEIMSDEYYAFWSNFIGAGMGYGADDWMDVTTAPDDEFLEDIPYTDLDFDEVDSGVTPKSSGSMGFKGRSMKIPKVYQYNYKKTVCKINGQNKSASTSGCGATSMCMVIQYLTGNTKVTPYLLFKWAYDNGRYHGKGLDHSAVSAMGKLCGVTGKWIGKDAKTIVKALVYGYPVIAHMGKGVFTKEGHYIVLRGITREGKILVNDPASSSRTQKAYPLSTILKQGKTSSPYMICWRDK